MGDNPTTQTHGVIGTSEANKLTPVEMAERCLFTQNVPQHCSSQPFSIQERRWPVL